jgi:hypothetical protein
LIRYHLFTCDYREKLGSERSPHNALSSLSLRIEKVGTIEKMPINVSAE